MGDPIESADLVVVGAGWYGLAAAKTYIEVHPTAQVVLFEAVSSIGGVWSTNRLSPGLKSNNLVGTYQYPDFPMDEETWGVKAGEHIPAKVMHEYLTAFATKFGVLERTRFGCKVESVERGEKGGWLLRTKTGAQKEESILAKKLIIATGMTSQAFLPAFKGQEDFERPLFHSKDFARQAETLKTSKKVVVLGGTKSAWDAVYAYGTAGVEVDWVIRESGHGPCWMSPPYVTPLKRWLEKLVYTRFLTWMSPCIWGDADGYGTIRSYLHGTAIGRFFVNTFWSILGNDVVTLTKYDSHPETKKLKPWMEPFWTGNGLSILNYPTDFLELVRSGQVKVRIADVERLEKGRVMLSFGETLETDAMVCVTGWSHAVPMKFIPSTLEAELGLPVLSSNQPARVQAESDFLTSRADAEILSKLPRLKDQPAGNPKLKSCATLDSPRTNEQLSPLDMYRFTVPSNPDMLALHDIAFAGHLLTLGTAITSQVQALWITAYLDGKIPSLSSITSSSPTDTNDQVFDIQYNARLHNRFGKWRYPHGWAGKIPDFVFDGLPYIDLLLGDLGVETKRKRNWWRDATEAYGPEDYVGVVGEWMRKQDEK